MAKRTSRYAGMICEIERRIIRRALRRFDGQAAQAALFLGIARTQLYAKMRVLGITLRAPPRAPETPAPPKEAAATSPSPTPEILVKPRRREWFGVDISPP